MEKLSRKQVENRIKEFFARESFTPKETRKIRRLAMSQNVKLKGHKTKYCKNCLMPLSGTLSVSRTHKVVVCRYCNHRNKIKIV